MMRIAGAHCALRTGPSPTREPLAPTPAPLSRPTHEDSTFRWIVPALLAPIIRSRRDATIKTRHRTIGCRNRSTVLFTLAAALLTTAAHAANERAIKAMRYADAQRYRQFYGRAYTGTRPFQVDPLGYRVTFREHQRGLRHDQQEWQQQRGNQFVQAIGG